MKMALINIPDHGISGKGYSAPLGLAYIGAVVRSLDHEVRGYDLSANKRAIANYYLKEDGQFLDALLAFNPDYIGMTCTTTNRINLKFWAETFKKYMPGAHIIVGGPHPSFLPQNYLGAHPAVDALVLGEGESTIADYLGAHAEGRDLKTVPGIAYRARNGEIVVNGSRPAIENIDGILFPARDLFPMEEYDIKFGTIVGKTATVITSRGCGNTCKFCSTTRYWKKVRFRSAQNIVDELEHVMREFPFIRNFVFFDDTFTSNRDHAVSVCREIVRRNIKINWGCWSRTNILDDEYLKTLSESGCTTLSFGIESGSDEMLKTMRKNSTVRNNYKALTLPGKYGILSRGTMIAGMPEEKFGWAVDSLFFMVSEGINYKGLQISLKTFIFPGTPWEKWFRERYKDFSWENIPPRFKAGSFVDPQGNVALPCYRWRGIPYFTLWLLRKLMKYGAMRKALSLRPVQSAIRKFAYAFPSQYPKSLYD